MKKFLILFLSITSTFQVFSQDQTSNEKPRRHIYKINPWVSVPLTAALAVTNYYGVKYLKDKPGIDPAQLPNLTPDKVNGFDRIATRQHTYYTSAKRDMKISDILLSTTSVVPIFLMVDKRIRNDGPRVALMYLETMAIMANAYSWGVGHINRKRPYVFNPNEDPDRRTRKGSFNSFYGGHVAATAASTFFICKVFSDYYPDSKLRPYLYAAAVIPPAVVAYYRIRSGMHFPSDCIAGFAAGAFLGTIIPHIHKINYNKEKNKNLSLTPLIGPYNGMAMSYKF